MNHNFFAGPAILPGEVLSQAADSIRDFDGMGLSLLEISHRSKQFEAVMAESESLVLDLMGLDDSYAVLFLSGGASSQFFMVPMNILKENETACYVNSGVWASKAIKEAKLFGKVEVVASSEESNFSYIPKEFQLPSGAAYLHITSNNTIYGSQYHSWPEVEIPLFCDMSSDIFSRRLNFKQFDLIYAGAQKNLGPAGVTLVVIKKSLLGRAGRKLPSMLNYQVHLDGGSMYNTPPVFPIYVMMLTLRWVKKYGLEGIENRNRKKAETLYAEIDRNSLFDCPVAKEDRSWMNVVFTSNKADLENEFLGMCKKANCFGLNGHRSVGGFRASLYNALEQQSVDVLVDLMKSFEQKYA